MIDKERQGRPLSSRHIKITRKQQNRDGTRNRYPRIKPPRPHINDEAAWFSYWKAHGQEWRTEPEIELVRQQELEVLRDVIPDIEKGIYPFRGQELTRADIEWLLATHDGGRGPVGWNSEKSRRGLDLRGADLRQVDLSGLPLTCMWGGLEAGNEGLKISADQYDLASVLMTHARLRGTHLEGAVLVGAQLEGADLRNADLSGALLQGVQLKQADLREANFNGAFLQGADLRGARLDGTWIKNVDFRGIRLEGASLQGVNLEGTTASGAWLDGADLHKARLERTNLRCAHLKGAILTKTRLERVDFQEALLEGANFDRAHLGDVNLDKTCLERASLLKFTWGTLVFMGPS